METTESSIIEEDTFVKSVRLAKALLANQEQARLAEIKRREITRLADLANREKFEKHDALYGHMQLGDDGHDPLFIIAGQLVEIDRLQREVRRLTENRAPELTEAQAPERVA